MSKQCSRFFRALEHVELVFYLDLYFRSSLGTGLKLFFSCWCSEPYVHQTPFGEAQNIAQESFYEAIVLLEKLLEIKLSI